MGVRQKGIGSTQMASPPDSGVAIAEREAESRNPSGLRRELRKNVTAKPSVKPRSAGPPRLYQPVQSCKVSAPSVSKNVRQATAAAPRISLVWQEKRKLDPSQHPSERPSAGKPGQSKTGQPVQNSKESAPQVKKTHMHTTTTPCFASQPGQSKNRQPVQKSKESAPQVKKTRLHTPAASSCLASQPGQCQRCKSAQNRRESSQPVYKSHPRTTAAPSFASQPGESQRCKTVQSRRVSSQPVHKSHTRATAAPQKLSLEKPLAPKHPFRRRSKIKHIVHNSQTVLCGISAVIDEPGGTIGQKCWLCEDDLANPPADEESEPYLLPEVAVLACSHVFHSMCLQLVTPDKQLRDPPCFICMSNLA